MNHSTVCFALDIETNLVKIGCTSACPHVWIAGIAKIWHQRGKFPDRFRLVGVIPCDDKLELKRELHTRFAKWHQGHEWFDPVREIRLLISSETRGHACNECMNPSASENQMLSDQASAAVARALRGL